MARDGEAADGHTAGAKSLHSKPNTHMMIELAAKLTKKRQFFKLASQEIE